MKTALELIRRLVTGSRDYRAFMVLASRVWDDRLPGECPCCGHTGVFQPEPHLVLAESCPGCGSPERKRLLAPALRKGFVSFASQRVLHFAADPVVEKPVDKAGAGGQVTADYAPCRASEVQNVEGWRETYEDRAITDERGRTAHFGQYDHVRYFGADLRELFAAAGFTLRENTARGPETARYRLARGKKVFVAVKA